MVFTHDGKEEPYSEYFYRRATLLRPDHLPKDAPIDAVRSKFEAEQLVRSREGLERLLEDPHPLVRLIARSALALNRSGGGPSIGQRPLLGDKQLRFNLR